MAWSAEPSDWLAMPAESAFGRYVTTVADLPAHTPIASLKSQVERLFEV